MRIARPLALALALALALVAAPPFALAASPADVGAPASDAGETDAGDTDADDDDAGAPDAGPVWVSCVEKIPAGATRPVMRETFPERGLSGYAASLEVTVTHGSGETVFPGGIKLGSDEAASRSLKEVGFVIPNLDGGAAFAIETQASDVASVTKVTLPFVALPKEGGRNALVLPSMPITIARASGEVMTLCTSRHRILIEDPISNEADPQVKPNPPARSQREDWALARQVAIGLGFGVVLGVAGALLYRGWRRRPQLIVAPKPRLPWLTALDELDAIRRSKLIAEGRAAEYFDRVSNCVRKYLGARYGFDGLESTTDEMRAVLKRVRPQVPGLKRIGAFLDDCDLVKFARATPDEEACLDALARGEEIVRTTIPTVPVADAPTSVGGAT